MPPARSWRPGIRAARGGDAIAAILFGEAEPSGRLPVTFPRSEAQLPRPVIPGKGAASQAPVVVNYVEGAEIGYRWFDRRRLAPLFPFGFGLSYTIFAYRRLVIEGGGGLTARFAVTNTGSRRGSDVAQLYALVPAADGPAAKRLVGWRKVTLDPGETCEVEIAAEPRLLAWFDSGLDRWSIPTACTVSSSAARPKTAGCRVSSTSRRGRSSRRREWLVIGGREAGPVARVAVEGRLQLAGEIAPDPVVECARGVEAVSAAQPVEPARPDRDMADLVAIDAARGSRRCRCRRRVRAGAIISGVTSSPRASSTSGTTASRASRSCAVAAAASHSPSCAGRSP